jgi:hypothetical protein
VTWFAASLVTLVATPVWLYRRGGGIGLFILNVGDFRIGG